MKYLVLAGVVTALCPCARLWAAQPAVPPALEREILAASALLVDAQTGEVVFSRRPDTPYPPASTVKLLTALLVWEKTGLEGEVEIAPEDADVEPSHVPLKAGEVVPVRDLTKALLVGSDNDTAMALGRKVAGDSRTFVQQMNERARQLGCSRSNFLNPNGLPAPGQVTTARDLMRIFRAVLAVPQLRSICAMPSFVLRTAVGAQRVKNHNKLLGVYAGMGPAKTGWTVASRHTYAASATRDGRELWLVILNSPNKWNDARLLFDYGFSRPKPEPRATDPEVLTVSAPPVRVKPPTAALRGAPEPGPAISTTAAPNSTPSKSAQRHKVRQGETLYSIARTYGVGVNQIVLANNLNDPRRLQPGTDLRIP
ncbi:MAG: LysM peptidoglycan-binding domain-containing protein [Candidatus Methylacidiphilales bacterium]|nr:LysM peptidoglycan-binding domain-containing protein [Candidatus Methylacidiphilales bacterium]